MHSHELEIVSVNVYLKLINNTLVMAILFPNTRCISNYSYQKNQYKRQDKERFTSILDMRKGADKCAICGNACALSVAFLQWIKIFSNE